MGERSSYPVAAPDYSDRRNAYFWTAKTIVMLGHRFLVRPHVEMDNGLVPLKRSGGAVFLYCGLHKSLWETTGTLAPLRLARVPLPYIGMGDNLVRGRLFRYLSKKVGTFFVRRPANRREMPESARKLRDDVMSFVAHGLDVMVFPEGTRKNIPTHGRYGDFFPAAFDAVLEYERNKPAILADNPGLSAREVFVVPFNVDYSRVREAEEMVWEQGAKPRTLHVLDSLSMIRNIGDTYMSYGTPIRVADHLGPRPQGARGARQAALPRPCEDPARQRRQSRDPRARARGGRLADRSPRSRAAGRRGAAPARRPLPGLPPRGCPGHDRPLRRAGSRGLPPPGPREHRALPPVRQLHLALPGRVAGRRRVTSPSAPAGTEPYPARARCATIRHA